MLNDELKTILEAKIQECSPTITKLAIELRGKLNLPDKIFQETNVPSDPEDLKIMMIPIFMLLSISSLGINHEDSAILVADFLIKKIETVNLSDFEWDKIDKFFVDKNLQ